MMDIYKMIKYLKKKIKYALDHNKYEDALEYISLLADILYNYNQYYFDKELEESIEIISYKILGKSKLDKFNNDTVVFYDGFGLDNRGLAHIYLLGLCKYKKIIYITNEKHKNNIPNIKDILETNNSNLYFIPKGTKLKKIEFVKTIIEKIRPQSIFMYTYPDDVVITTNLYYFENKIIRYQINLTDHAFWLGSKCIDYCIEFRNYGAYLSYKYRSIDKNKLILLPYYPMIDKTIKFKGYPFNLDENSQKIVFSGGSLYKTFGGENKYYVIVDYILSKYRNIIFWYAGNGDSTKIKKLAQKYPNRVFLTPERKDLYQVLKRCYFYLSTYPLCGGLMFQYAAVAGKLPITLRYDDVTDGFLINQENLDIEFNSLDKIKEKIDNILLDESYLKYEEKRIKKSVISQEEFDENLKNLLENNKTNFIIELKAVNTINFLKEYADNMTYIKLTDIVATHMNIRILKVLPKEFLIGILLKLKRKLIRR